MTALRHLKQILISAWGKSVLSWKTRLGLWIAACLTGLVGVVNLLSAVNPSLPERVAFLRDILPGEVRASGHIFAALSGFVLLTLASNLLRRKRMAWLMTVVLLIVSIISHMVKGLDYEESFLALVLLIQLLWMRSVFTAQSDRPSIAQGVRVLLGALLFTLSYGTAGFYFLDGHYQINFDLGQALGQTLAMFFTEDNAGLTPQTRFAAFFADSIYTVGTVTLAYAFWMLLRPVLMRDPATLQERELARQIIDQQGQTSLARLSLLNDKSYYFSPSGQSVVAYVAKGRAAIALGLPIGPASDQWETTISFQQFCQRNDWYPCFYEVPPETMNMFYQLGFRVLKIGEEAIVDLNTFSLKGKEKQNLRTALNRLSKTGHTVQLHEPPLSDTLLSQLKIVSDEWLSSAQGSEKRFSIGWFSEAYLRDCLIATVYDPAGQIIAFVNLLGQYHQPEVTVDMMRYRRSVPNGTMDFLFVSLFQQLQALGYQRFNFSLSPLAGLAETSASPRLEKALRYLSDHLNHFYNFQGLHFFKEKFDPHWEPRYLVYPKLVNLPEVVVALVRADSGDRLLDYLKPGT